VTSGGITVTASYNSLRNSQPPQMWVKSEAPMPNHQTNHWTIVI
jgi:hypothetical protein